MERGDGRREAMKRDPSQRPQRKRNHLELSPMDRGKDRMTTRADRGNTARKKQKPQIAFGRRVPVQNRNVENEVKTHSVMPHPSTLDAEWSQVPTETIQRKRTKTRNETKQDKKPGGSERRRDDESSLIEGLVDLMLTTTRHVASNVGMTSTFPVHDVTSLSSQKQTEVDSCMHLPIRWRSPAETMKRFSHHGNGQIGDPPKDVFAGVMPDLSLKQPPKDYWTEIVGVRNNDLNSDDLVKQFIEDLIEKTTVEEERSQAMPKVPCRTPMSISPMPNPLRKENASDSISIVQNIEKTPKPVDHTSPAMTVRTTGEKRGAVHGCRDQSIQTSPKTREMITDGPLESHRGEVLGTDTTAADEAGQLRQTTTSEAHQRLWRPTMSFYAACASADSETRSSENTEEPIASSHDDGSMDTISRSQAQVFERRSTVPVKETLKWKHFRAQLYKERRQRCVRRHGIYDPLLFTSSTESNTTSESEFSSSFLKCDGGAVNNLTLPACQR